MVDMLVDAQHIILLIGQQPDTSPGKLTTDKEHFHGAKLSELQRLGPDKPESGRDRKSLLGGVDIDTEAVSAKSGYPSHQSESQDSLQSELPDLRHQNRCFLSARQV
jgi:hypothetical protein